VSFAVNFHVRSRANLSAACLDQSVSDGRFDAGEGQDTIAPIDRRAAGRLAIPPARRSGASYPLVLNDRIQWQPE